MVKRRLAIVRGQRIDNKSAKGKPAYGQLKGLMNYIAYGRYADNLDRDPKQRGLWLDHQGQTVSHEASLQWAKEKVHRYGCDYTYQLLLSTRHGGLATAEFNHVLAQGSELSGVREWRMMVHEDTANQHAHVLLLRREKLARDLYKEWQQRLQAELEQLQAERHQERQLETGLTLSAPEQAQSQEWEMGL